MRVTLSNMPPATRLHSLQRPSFSENSLRAVYPDVLGAEIMLTCQVFISGEEPVTGAGRDKGRETHVLRYTDS